MAEREMELLFRQRNMKWAGGDLHLHEMEHQEVDMWCQKVGFQAERPPDARVPGLGANVFLLHSCPQIGGNQTQKRSGDPNPKYFSKSTAVQMGGVLPYKWEAYCSINGRRAAGFPFLRSLEARKARGYKWGAYCRTNGRCIAVLFRQVVGVGVSETLPIQEWRHSIIVLELFRIRKYIRVTLHISIT